jgi:glycosyltransferase involved in cell wall biosynthesis
MILGIDASHTQAGGAISHVRNLLKNLDLKKYSIDKIYVFIPKKTSKLLPNNNNIIYVNNYFINGNLFLKIFWQIFFLKKQLRKNKCNILLVTGGYFFINFNPIVSISQNILPFYKREVRKFFPSFFYFKLIILNFFLKKSFLKANKVIFLSKHSKYFISKEIGGNIKSVIIGHCLSDDLIKNLKKTNAKKNTKSSIRIIFISDIIFYKNHKNVLLALSLLRDTYNIKLFCFGSYEKSSFTDFNNLRNQIDPERKYIFYRSLKHNTLLRMIKCSDIFLYSSYCESFPVSIMEGMASGKPMLVSNTPVFKEILRSNAIYFNIDSLEDLKSKLIKIINLPLNKKKLNNKKNYQLLLTKYSQKLVREKTFLSLKKTFDDYYQ